MRVATYCSVWGAKAFFLNNLFKEIDQLIFLGVKVAPRYR